MPIKCNGEPCVSAVWIGGMTDMSLSDWNTQMMN